MILGNPVLNTRVEVQVVTMLIGPVKVEWFSATREKIGVECLLHTAAIRSTGGAMVRCSWLRPRLFSEKC